MKYFSKKLSPLIVLCFIAIGCFDPDAYEALDKDKIIKLSDPNNSTAHKSTLADGKNAVQVTAMISDKAATSRRKVIFRTSLGFFQGGTGDSIVVEADDKYTASASLSSLQAGAATVTAEIMGVKAKEEPKIKFDPASPDAINVVVDSFAVYNNYRSEVQITATLSTANGGKASAGHQVNFNVTNAAGTTIGDFVNNIKYGFSSTDGKVRIRYSAGEIDTEGYLTIAASTLNKDGKVISANTRIYLSRKF